MLKAELGLKSIVLSLAVSGVCSCLWDWLVVCGGVSSQYKYLPHDTNIQSGMSYLASKLGQIGSKWDKSGTF